MADLPMRLVIESNAKSSSLPSPLSSVHGSPTIPEPKDMLPLVEPTSPTEEHEGFPTAVRKCNYCGATSTPMWRHGPGNYTNLCNSCGGNRIHLIIVRWRRGKILASGDNRHHLCKAAMPKKRIVEDVSQAKSSIEEPSTKRKIEEDHISRKPKPLCARQLWTPEQSSDFEVEVSPEVGYEDEALTLNLLTANFASLLESLDSSMVAAFTAILAQSFLPAMTTAYDSGKAVEMSVLDISPQTWDALRSLVSII